MSEITITEALAELKTIGKRIIKKREFITSYLYRQERFKDPLVNEGGSQEAIARERQAIRDLEERTIRIRDSIARANQSHTIEIQGELRTIADWLVWRREVAPQRQQFMANLSNRINNVRQQAQQQGASVASSEMEARSNDVIINVSEQELADERERLETILGELDGQLSLKNATITIEV